MEGRVALNEITPNKGILSSGIRHDPVSLSDRPLRYFVGMEVGVGWEKGPQLKKKNDDSRPWDEYVSGNTILYNIREILRPSGLDSKVA